MRPAVDPAGMARAEAASKLRVAGFFDDADRHHEAQIMRSQARELSDFADLVQRFDATGLDLSVGDSAERFVTVDADDADVIFNVADDEAGGSIWLGLACGFALELGFLVLVAAYLVAITVGVPILGLQGR